MECFKCGQRGHYAAACPLNRRALNDAEHFGRIRQWIDRWVAGEITVERKRIGISDENKSWYGPDCPRHLTYP